MDSDVDEHWVNQRINGLRHDRQVVWVLIRIEVSGMHLTLCTPNYPHSGGGGGRAPNGREREIFDLWDERGLGNGQFSGGNLVAFLKQVRRMI